MTKEEFLKVCAESGYCCREVAKEYATAKEEFTYEDLREVWLINQRRLVLKNGEIDKRFRIYSGVKTTKRFDTDTI